MRLQAMSNKNFKEALYAMRKVRDDQYESHKPMPSTSP
jgi:hypothetical protein